jgi:uncharacterized membrane protein
MIEIIFLSNLIIWFKKYQKRNKFTNIYSKQFLTNSPFYQIKPVQIFFKQIIKFIIFYILIRTASRIGIIPY